MTRTGLVLVTAGLAAGCLDPAPAGVVEQAKGCPIIGCGTNSPAIEVWEFHELDEAGAPNDVGIRLEGMFKNGQPYQADVTGDRLVALSPDPSAYPSLTGLDLEDAYFLVEDSHGTEYQIHIRHVSQLTTFWIGDANPIETYELEYTGPASVEPQRLCKNPPDNPTQWPAAYESILFTGDRYDGDAKTVIADNPSHAGTSFNIACAGGALAKLHLNRHTHAGSDAIHLTTAGERQALLKMYVSDVCGTGEAWTVPGEPLHWENDVGWQTLEGTETSFESLWGPNGALCLDEHRLEADSGYPGIRAQIAAACRAANHPIPKCSSLPGFPAAWPRGAYILSANP